MKKMKKIGEVIGFILMYLIFTNILYFIFRHKIDYFQSYLIAILILCVGVTLREVLK